MSTHTPGPWKAVDQTTSILLKQEGAKGHYLFTLKAWPGIAEAEANAALIAAAPDLLKALRKAIRAMPYAPGDICTGADHDEALAAIAKAEGRS